MEFKDIRWPEKVFVTGIGTDVGKSWATGWLAREMSKEGITVITQKFVQTGNRDFSEDIEVHRKIMGIPMQPEDLDHTTAPEIFSYPCSPELAARIDGREIDFAKIDDATAKLCKKYDHVLIEGAGGLMVPLHGDYLTCDYIRERRLPVLLVTGGRLGSISDTLLNLEVIAMQRVELFGVVWNPHFDKDETIARDTKAFVERWIARRFPDAVMITMDKEV